MSTCEWEEEYKLRDEERMKMSGGSARTTEVMEAERNCSAETNAGTGKWWRQSLLMSSSEEEASENMSIAHAASLL